MSALAGLAGAIAAALGQADGPLGTTVSPLGTGTAPAVSPEVAARVSELIKQTEQLSARVDQLASDLVPSVHRPLRLEIFHGYIGVFAVAFLVTLIATPFMRKLAIANGVIDRPSVARKIHKMPVAYLGGVAVYLGILAGVLFAITEPFHHLVEFHVSSGSRTGIPAGAIFSILLGMTVIMICGLIDDVVGIDPRAKIAGMLFAAAALATQDVGVKVAAGLIVPMAKAVGIRTMMVGNWETLAFVVPLPGTTGITIDVVYWVGTAVIAVFVLGACNASNLIDGLDGLCAGTTSIAAAGLLFVALALAVMDDGPLDAMRVVLCLALLGGCLGFLPHNFNPATIFLGDAGSLMLGFLTIVIVLTLGDTSKTHLVLAGLIIYAIPIMDTTLAIVRRKISGKSISAADDQHLHHMLKRALGVKGAVFVLYGIGFAFALLGIALSEERGRVTYALTLVFAAFIGVTSFKVARRAHFEQEAQEMAASGRGKVERNADSSSPAATREPRTAEARRNGLESADKPAPREDDPLVRR
jgi:UDP-GlcNAc:undecaprenyl-phosphate GlcNAc-1-phosphate transferase